MILKSYYVCEDCSGCSRRENCFKGQYENRKTELSKTMRRQKDEAEKRISTDKGILLRMNRSIQVESAFGVLKHCRHRSFQERPPLHIRLIDAMHVRLTHVDSSSPSRPP